MNYTAPAGSNRFMLVMLSLERDHSPFDSRSDNFETDDPGVAFPTISFGDRNLLRLAYSIDSAGSSSDFLGTEISRSFYVYGLFYPPGGEHLLQVSGVNTPTSAGDEAVLAVATFANVGSFQPSNGPGESIVRTAPFNIALGVSPVNPGDQPPGTTPADNLLLAFGTSSKPETLTIGADWRKLLEVPLANPNGSYASSPGRSKGAFSENDGHTLLIQAIQGVTTNQTARLTSPSNNLQSVSMHAYRMVAHGCDYGDAPASYGDAFHSQSWSRRIGAQRGDAEEATPTAPNATGDDNSKLADEDGVSIPSLTAGESATITAEVAGSGYLSAWIDWNGDGDFADAGEQIATDLEDTDTNGIVTIPVNVPMGTTTNQTYARFRWSASTGIGPAGWGSYGEVEDYPVTVSPSSWVLPVSGIPSSCSAVEPDWTEEQIDASPANFTMMLGGKPVTVTTEVTNAVGNTLFQGDQFNYSGSVSADSGSALAGNVQLSLRQNSQDIVGATTRTIFDMVAGDLTELNLFLSDMESSNAVIFAEDASGTRLAPAAWTIASYEQDGATPASQANRYRMTSTELNVLNAWDSTGIISSNTQDNDAIRIRFDQATLAVVERIVVETVRTGVTYKEDNFEFMLTACPSAARDYSDAPTATLGGASHAIVAGLYLGGGVTADTSDYNTVAADGDVDDGISILPMISGDTTSYSIPAANINGTGTGTLYAWIDFDGNGSFDSDEFASVAFNNGVSGDLTFSGFGAVTTGPRTYARFRLTTDTLTSAQAATVAADGEVEDYLIRVNNGYQPVLPTKQCEVSAAGWNFNFSPDFTGESSYGMDYAGTGWLYDGDGIPRRSPTQAPNSVMTLGPYQKPTELRNNPVADGRGETWLLVSRFEAAPSTSQSIVFEDRAGGDHDVFAVIDSAGNVLGRYPATGSDNVNNTSVDGSEITLNFTMPADGVVYAHIWVSDFGVGFGNHYANTCRQDYSDSPADGAALSSGSTAAYGVAVHGVVGGVQLGATITDETGAVENADNASDDGVAIFPVLTIGDTGYSIPAAGVSGLGSGTLYAWIDFDGNGSFDSDEFASAAFNNGISTDLNFSGFGSVTASGTTYARIRLSTDTLTGADAATVAGDGEVEDYAITVNNYYQPALPTKQCEVSASGWRFNFTANFSGEPDYRLNYAGTGWSYDAAGIPRRSMASVPNSVLTLGPTQKPTELRSNPVSDGRGETWLLVSRFEAEPSSTQSIVFEDESQEDHDVFAVIDSAGNILARYPATGSDNVNNNSISTGNPLDGPPITLSFTMPADGVVYTHIWLNDFGVEFGRHYANTCRLDYSDSPADGTALSSGATAAYGVASHIINDMKLGPTITEETGAVENADNASDDGVTDLPSLTTGDTSYSIPAASLSGTGVGTLYAWVDFDGNGSFDSDEFASVAFNNGASGPLDFNSFGSVTANGGSHARFRLTTDTLTAADAATTAADGEVEDYAFTLGASTLCSNPVESVNTDVTMATLLAGGTVSLNGVNVSVSTTGRAESFTTDGVIQSGVHLNKDWDVTTSSITYHFSQAISRFEATFDAHHDQEIITFSHPASTVINRMNSTGGLAPSIMSQATLENGGMELRSNLTDQNPGTSSEAFGSKYTVIWNFPVPTQSLTITVAGSGQGGPVTITSGTVSQTNYNGTIIDGAFKFITCASSCGAMDLSAFGSSILGSPVPWGNTGITGTFTKIYSGQNVNSCSAYNLGKTNATTVGMGTADQRSPGGTGYRYQLTFSEPVTNLELGFSSLVKTALINSIYGYGEAVRLTFNLEGGGTHILTAGDVSNLSRVSRSGNSFQATTMQNGSFDVRLPAGVKVVSVIFESYDTELDASNWFCGSSASNGILLTSANACVADAPPNPAWVVTKATNSKPSKIGDTLNYTFTLANTGDQPVSGILVSDPKCAATPVLQSGDTLANNILDVGETHVYACTSVGITQAEVDAGVVNNTVTVSGVPANGTLTNATDSIATPIVAELVCVGVPVATLGGAYVNANNEYVLTEDLINQKGFVWSVQKIDLALPFDIELAVYLGSNTGINPLTGLDAGADGLAFILQNDPRGVSAEGFYGGGMGVDGAANLGLLGITEQAVSPSVTIEFDTFDNSPYLSTGDIAADHTGIYLNGDVYQPDAANTLLAATPLGELEDGQYHIARFVWDPVTWQLRYYLDGTQLASLNSNLMGYLGSRYVRFGLSAATGASKNEHKACWINPPAMTAGGYTLSGTVFEDIHYGGGAGRNFASAGTPISGATVELYGANGVLLETTTTAADGTYRFIDLKTRDPIKPAGIYFVRVVNRTVSSTHAGVGGYEIGVQTFRTNKLDSDPVPVPVTDKVGGEFPAQVDAPANDGTARLYSVYPAGTDSTFINGGGYAQSVAQIRITKADVSGVDFGFNFNTVVNTNGNGQGSLAQFLINNTVLDNSMLNQDLPASIDGDYATGDNVAVFMIPPALLTGSEAVIMPTTLLLVDKARTVIDGRVQALLKGSGTIVLDGAGAGFSGLAFDGVADDSVARELLIRNFGGSGLMIYGTGSSTGQGVSILDSAILDNGQYGVSLASGAKGNRLLRNSLLNNGWAGIASQGDRDNTFSQNSLFNNGQLGIDLGADGVTANSKVDTWLDYPDVTSGSVSSNGSNLLSYDFDLDVPLNTNGYRVEFFSNTAVDPSGHGEGQRYLGYVDIDPFGTGPQNFKGSATALQPVPEDANIAMTLIEKTSATTLGSTSEFSGIRNGGLSVCTSVLDSSSTWPTMTLLENTQTITYLESVDADGNPITYIISGGVDSSAFAVLDPAPGAAMDCSTLVFETVDDGVITTRSMGTFRAAGTAGLPGDFEAPQDVGLDNVYELTLTAIDIHGNSVTRDLKVMVQDVNEAPMITTPARIEVQEGHQTAVVDIQSWDPDAGDVEGSGLSYAITGGKDARQFAIDPASGELQLVQEPDFENPLDSNADNTYEVTVTVYDDQGLAGSRDLSVVVTDDSSTDGVQLRARVLLQGPYDAATGLMADDLREKGYLPVYQPYHVAPFAYQGTETINLDLTTITGPDAMVDWILLELRAADNPAQIVASKAVLLQRDGDLVDAGTGHGILGFSSLAGGNYYVAVRHRNHLGVITASPVALNGAVQLVDFSLPALAVAGTDARLESTDLALLWAGDINHDQRIAAMGTRNDLMRLLGTVLTGPRNQLFNSSFRQGGYLDADINMDGTALFAGPGNDANILTGNVLMHPANTGYLGNFLIQGMIP
ncbi:MAG TPA: GEVED domain-containing protein [Thiolinea sp.]|nr:GEVED domain-containing protein [Thiolinea sp.]